MLFKYVATQRAEYFMAQLTDLQDSTYFYETLIGMWTYLDCDSHASADLKRERKLELI